MDLDALRSFAVFAEHRNFTRAAEALHISQPALHVKIAKLGESLGVSLYEKRGRQLFLTPDGERTLAFAREMAEREGAFRAALARRDAAAPVTLAAGEGTLLFLVDGAVRRYRSERGLPPLRLIVRDAAGTIEAVRRGEAHLGLCPALAAADDLVEAPLAEVGMVAALPAKHRLARRESLAPGDLDGEPLVLPPRGRMHRAVVEGALAAAGARCEVGVEATGWTLMLHFVRLGLGVAVVNDCCRAPAGVVLRPLAGLPRLRYRLYHRLAGLPPAGERLRTLLSETSPSNA
jgi:DNA-binding transcriptional LysR family regulator